MKDSENIEFYNFIKCLSNYIDDVIKKNTFESNEYKQKLYAISSFIEFLNAGASVRVLPIENNNISFVISMK